MANEDKNLSHAAPETVEELEALKDWWDAHGNKVTIVMIAMLVAVIGFQQYGRWRERANVKSMSDFDSARTPEALEELITANSSSVVTPLARLRLASVYFNDEKFALSQSAYEGFLAENAKHRFAPVAQMGLAHCLEANGQVSEAADKFRRFAEANPGSFLAPTARLGLGRCLILSGKVDEGKKVLDLFLTEKAGTRWAAYADELIRSMDIITIPSAPASTDLSSFFSAEESAPVNSATASSEPGMAATPPPGDAAGAAPPAASTNGAPDAETK